MKIIVDAFGGDNAPLSILRGCEMAVNELKTNIILTGDEKKLLDCAAQNNISLKGMEILHAPDVITMEDDPSCVIKSKKDTSSMSIGMKALVDGKGDAFVSAGSTGAFVMGATFIVKRIKGVKRGVIATILPTRKGPCIVMDSGANIDCRADMLVQFALLGSLYAENVLKIKNPRVGLLNVGIEDTKGDQLHLEAYSLLKEASINFVGNVEARALTDSVCDILVTDGFSGNVIIKTVEGIAAFLMDTIKEALLSNKRGKLAGLLARSTFRKMKSKLDYSEYGGAPILGISAPVIKAHGSSDAKAIKNAIRQGIIFAQSDAIKALEN